MSRDSRSRLAAIGPGILLAATTVGAGDLLTTSLAGSEAGLTVLWAVPAGVALKWTLSEGIARWQMATGATLVEGWVLHLGRWIRWVFLAYLLLFTFVVGGALMTACGVAGTGFWQLTEDANTSKILWGVIHSMAGLLLVRLGSFRLFETLMSICVGLMSASMLLTAILIQPDWAGVVRGLVPSVPPSGPGWVLGVLGGIGGTLTLLSYGYWIREVGRAGAEGLKECRFDLAISYVVILLFGMSVLTIGSRTQIHGQGVDLALALADQLAQALGPVGRWALLIGFWGTVFSSILGVWQSVPYLFVDFLRLGHGYNPGEDVRGSRAYRGYMLGIATVPMVLLFRPVKQIQLAFGILGAMFLPLLSLTILLMTNRREWVGERFRSGFFSNAVLVITLVFFGYLGAQEIWGVVRGW